jgi:hypothetical protein
MTETPANTPNPIGNTSSFFPGGSKGVDAAPAASALAAGDWVGSNELEDGDKGNGDDEDGSTLSGCGVAIGFGTEVSPYETVREGKFLGNNGTAHNDYHRSTGR